MKPRGASIPTRDRDGLTVAELLEAYHEHAKRHYRGADGKPTSELREHQLVIRTLRRLHSETIAAEFGPMALKTARQEWIVAGLARSECNRRTNIARRIFRWAVAEELVHASVLTALEAVDGLKRGRSAARETKPVGPVEDAVVDATIPHLSRIVAGLVEFQRLTGCRPGEACRLRRRDMDTGGEVWLYKPAHHKNAYRGQSRVIAIGPKAQQLLKPFLTPDLDAFLFSPAVAVAEYHAERTKNRETPRYKSHMVNNRRRRTTRPKRPPADRYTPGSYSDAIARACDRAFPLPARLAHREGEGRAKWWGRLSDLDRKAVKEWWKSHRWHPNQLRHSFATKVRKAHGLEAAQVLLGHAKADVTQIYAEKNEALAVAIAGQIG